MSIKNADLSIAIKREIDLLYAPHLNGIIGDHDREILSNETVHVVMQAMEPHLKSQLILLQESATKVSQLSQILQETNESKLFNGEASSHKQLSINAKEIQHLEMRNQDLESQLKILNTNYSRERKESEIAAQELKRNSSMRENSMKLINERQKVELGDLNTKFQRFEETSERKEIRLKEKVNKLISENKVKDEAVLTLKDETSFLKQTVLELKAQHKLSSEKLEISNQSITDKMTKLESEIQILQDNLTRKSEQLTESEKKTTQLQNEVALVVENKKTKFHQFSPLTINRIWLPMTITFGILAAVIGVFIPFSK